MKEIRVLIADDHPVFRFGMRALLTAEPDTEVVAEAASGQEALDLVASAQPDVVLMDINMPGINGIEATRRIVQNYPQVRILIVTMIEDDTVFAAMRAGASGYLVKGAEGEETLRAIRAVANGESIFSPKVAQRLAHFFSTAPAQIAQPFPQLTSREREILGMIAQGYTNTAIAEQLFLSPKTVRNQVSTIFSKLDAADRSEAIILARTAGVGL
ncbi:MAG: response regulator transcription factor [Caldilineaceae bacterium]|nr:response regulator transcription factor [Caldilineaceae bacterium]MBP8108879.1 response regulator transcription factor [Caldilineaceae bacterium]MBP8124811.1 response regulator transcription factor [Caldilineaceae bacterium]MBP9074446.1 response regulator transcription factor [Caldilineaceae bacterium]